MRILLIEDDELLARAVARCLLPHRVVLVSSLEEATAAMMNAELHEQDIDAVFCNLRLGARSTVDFIEMIDADTTVLHGRVFILTGGPRGERELRCVERRRARVIYKHEVSRGQLHAALGLLDEPRKR